MRNHALSYSDVTFRCICCTWKVGKLLCNVKLRFFVPINLRYSCNYSNIKGQALEGSRENKIDFVCKKIVKLAFYFVRSNMPVLVYMISMMKRFKSFNITS